MTTTPSVPKSDAKPQTASTPSPLADADEGNPSALASGQATTDTLADAADEKGTVRATRRMPEPDSLGG